MPESQHTPEQPKPETPPYTPASPSKRIAAWVGVAYMVILVALTTYAIATGETLGGLTGLLLAPACGGLAAVTWMRWRRGEYRGGRASALFVVVLAAAAFVLNLFWGVLSLTLQLGG